MPTIYTSATRAEVLDEIRKLPLVLSGRTASYFAEGFFLRIGNAALSKIQQAYIAKARGGTDEAGEQWKPLKRETIAQRRTTKAELKSLGITGKRTRGFLTPDQDREWRKLFKKYFLIFRVEEGEVDAKRHAAAVAWTILKEQGARTKLDVLGSRQVEILRDTGVLFNSLSPGVEDARPTNDGQLFEITQGSVILGSKLAYAARQHKTRRLWPDPKNWPDSWWKAITRAASTGIVRIIELSVRKAA